MDDKSSRSSNNMKLYDYQERLLEKCKKSNIIICLPTGSGKTMIAIETIKYNLNKTKGEYPQVAKRSFFLAPKRALVLQQFQAINNILAAKILMVTGDDEPEKFNKEQWLGHFKNYQVFVFTPDILLDILAKGYILMKNINIIVFDEMHWAFKDGTKPSGHPYSRIMTIYHEQSQNLSKDEMPRIIGLSASVFSNDSSKILSYSIQESLSKIEKFYDSKIEGGGFSYSHKYKVELIPYKTPETNLNQIDIGFNFEKLFQIFEEFKHKTFLPQFKLSFRKVKMLLTEEMGVWFAQEYVNMCCDSLSKNPDIKFEECREIMLEIMRLLSKFIQFWLQKNCIPLIDSLWKEKKLISFKLQRLLDLIEKLGSQFNSKNFTALLFTSERTDANLIYRWLKLFAENDERFSFLKLGFICGSLVKDFIHFDSQYNHWEFLKELRDRNINFIVSTAVLEEGVDIPACNVVIRYDGVPNYCSYCQSRGRARDDNSFFYIMTPKEEHDKIKLKLLKYAKLDELLANVKSPTYIDVFEKIKNVTDDVEILTEVLNYADLSVEERSLMKPYVNGESRLYPRESLQLMNRYIMKLPKDLFTQQKIPLILFQKEFINSLGVSQKKYSYIFVFPINSDYTGTVIKGGYFWRKKNAAMHCAFRVCVFLIKKGDIDQNLNVSNQKGFILQEQVKKLNIRYVPGVDDEKQFKTKVYHSKTSDYFRTILENEDSPNKDSIYHLYMIEFYGDFDVNNMDEELQKQLYKPLFVTKAKNYQSPYNSNETIGILLSNAYSLDKVQSYFYFNLFPIKFELKFCGQFDLKNDMEKIYFFHQHVLIMFFKKLSLNENSPLKSGMYIVPIDKSRLSIDFKKIESLQNWLKFYKYYNQNVEKNLEPSTSLDDIRPYDPFHSWNLNDNFTLFSCIHHKIMRLYFVQNVSDVKCDDLMMKPTENQPGQTYFDYYKSKYKRIIRDKETPLISSKEISPFHINYHLFKQKSTILHKVNRNAILFPLEYISIYPMTSVMYLRIASLPVLLYRLEQYFLGKEFGCLVSKQIGYSGHENRDGFQIDDILLRQKTIKQVYYDESSLEEIELVDVASITEDPNQKKKAPETMAFQKFLEEEKFSNQNINESQENVVRISETQEKLFDELRILLGKIDKKRENEHRKYQRYINPNEMKKPEFGDPTFFKFKGNIDDYIRKENFKLQTFDRFDSPNPWHIIQGLTLRKAQDSWNIERSEVIGDSFIKFTCSLYLFFLNPEYNVMKFDSLKTCLINNKNLFKIAIEKNIVQYISSSLHQAIPINFFRKLIAKNMETQKEYRPELRYKDVADCVESLIGTFLVHGGAGMGLKFLNKFLDLKSFDPVEMMVNSTYLKEFFQYKLNPQFSIHGPEIVLEDSKRIELSDIEIKEKLENRFDPQQIKYEIQKSYDELSMNLLEEEIDYVFKEKYLLVQALTHPSMSNSEDVESGETIYNFIPSYQRLEFIGDAILDYSIIRYVYEKDDALDPTDITFLRQALVNNCFYASISVKYGLHKFIRHSSFGLKNFIYKFVNRFTNKYIEQVKTLLDEGMTDDETIDVNDIDVPKTLADIFESLIGAIYIDCHFNLDCTWRVIYKMIKVEIDNFIQEVPIMPLHRLSQFHHNIRFTDYGDYTDEGLSGTDDKFQRIVDRKMIKLTQEGVGTFIGYGRNKRQCKISAAKKFFAYLKSKEENIDESKE